MPTPMKVRVLIAQFCYGGNGGVATVLPHFVPWMAKLLGDMHKDQRISDVHLRNYGDVPLTMERNRVVRHAIEGGYDVVMMLDSDNRPDLELGVRASAKPFWQSSFDFLYERLTRGVPTVIAAPYCGPPPDPIRGGEENVYVFHFQDLETGAARPQYSLKQYSRTYADQMSGIQPCDAAPTGVIIYSTSAFDLMRFDRRPKREILEEFRGGKIDVEECLSKLSMQSYFWYEFTDQWQSQKASTEDVVNTREIGMAGQLKFGEQVLFCNWDAWAGHYKPKCVGRPNTVRINEVNEVYRQAVLTNLRDGENLLNLDFTKNLASRLEHCEPVEQVIAETEEPAQGGVEVRSRLICGRKMHSVGHVTPDSHLAALTLLANRLSLNLRRPLKMLEVGSWVGESAVALLGGTASSEIFCVDTWKGSLTDWTGELAAHWKPFKWFMENCGDLIGKQIKPYSGASLEVAEMFDEPQDLDLIFLDADHSHEAVLADLCAWHRHLSRDGIMCGHDYCPEFPGVQRALENFLMPNGIHVSVIPGTSVWFFANADYYATLPWSEANGNSAQHIHV